MLPPAVALANVVVPVIRLVILTWIPMALIVSIGCGGKKNASNISSSHKSSIAKGPGVPPKSPEASLSKNVSTSKTNTPAAVSKEDPHKETPKEDKKDGNADSEISIVRNTFVGSVNEEEKKEEKKPEKKEEKKPEKKEEQKEEKKPGKKEEKKEEKKEAKDEKKEKPIEPTSLPPPVPKGCDKLLMVDEGDDVPPESKKTEKTKSKKQSSLVMA